LSRKSPIRHPVRPSTRSRGFIRGSGERVFNPQGNNFKSAPRANIDEDTETILQIDNEEAVFRKVKAGEGDRVVPSTQKVNGKKVFIVFNPARDTIKIVNEDGKKLLSRRGQSGQDFTNLLEDRGEANFIKELKDFKVIK